MKRTILLSTIAFISLTACHYVVEEPVPVVHYDIRDEFTGAFDVEEYSETLDSYHYYTIRIVKAAGHSESVYIKNFYGAGINVIADVEGHHLYIPHQEVAGYHIEGEATIAGNQLDLTYSVHDHMAHHDFVDYCYSVAWR